MVIEWHLWLGSKLTGFVCSRIGHVHGYFWTYGDEVCPRCGEWLNVNQDAARQLEDQFESFIKGDQQ